MRVTTVCGVELPKKWRFNDPIKLAQRQSDNTVRPVAPALFSPGDFVRATVKFDVIVCNSKERENELPTVNVRLSLLSLVQLIGAGDVPKVSR